MALNLKNLEVERLVDEIAKLTGESKTEAVRRSLEERRQRLAYRIGSTNARERVAAFLEHEVWPQIPRRERGRRLSRAEEDELLGFHQTGA